MFIFSLGMLAGVGYAGLDETQPTAAWQQREPWLPYCCAGSSPRRPKIVASAFRPVRARSSASCKKFSSTHRTATSHLEGRY